METQALQGHTPGPWFVGDDYCVSTREGYAIARVTTMDDFPAIDEDQVKQGEAVALANARLIAAAPDLLEALQNLLTGPTWPGAQMTARAAIARATHA
jgi:hypothetical protein